MIRSEISNAQWQRLSDMIAQRLGLHFPPARHNALERGFRSAVPEFGFADPAVCMDWLLAAPRTEQHEQILAAHLTVAETYFFREWKTLQALTGNILPSLINRRRGRDQHLRILSAACCTGEEAYSLAILLHQLLPDMQDWRIELTATDINRHSLEKAAAGVYGKWSFRGVPALLKARYFTCTADGNHAVIPEIRNMVRFQTLNLAQDSYPSRASGIHDMDIILCRNVLMYFTPDLVPRVINNLHDTLGDGGWLAVSPSEACSALFPRFEAVNFPGAILFRKKGAGCEKSSVLLEGRRSRVPMHGIPMRPVQERPNIAAKHPDSAESTVVVPTGTACSRLVRQPSLSAGRLPSRTPSFQHLPGQARMLADRGRLTEALSWCDRWIAADKLNAAGYYVRAAILQEKGELEPARAALNNAIYLDQEFVMAHFTLGMLARGCGDGAAERRHFGNTRQLLSRHQPGDPLPESDGISAGQLADILAFLEGGAELP